MKVELNNTFLILCEAAAFRYKSSATVDNFCYDVSVWGLPQLPKVVFSEYMFFIYTNFGLNVNIFMVKKKDQPIRDRGSDSKSHKLK